jgi:hypothetical protein
MFTANALIERYEHLLCVLHHHALESECFVAASASAAERIAFVAPAMAPEVATLRAAAEGDVPQINAIHAFYVLNTVITFTITPATDDEALAKFKCVVSQDLPYSVVVDPIKTGVVGFAYTSGFRSGLSGYRHTV